MFFRVLRWRSLDVAVLASAQVSEQDLRPNLPQPFVETLATH